MPKQLEISLGLFTGFCLVVIIKFLFFNGYVEEEAWKQLALPFGGILLSTGLWYRNLKKEKRNSEIDE